MNGFSAFLLICCLIFSIVICGFAAWIYKLKIEINKLNGKNDFLNTQLGQERTYIKALKEDLDEANKSHNFTSSINLIRADCKVEWIEGTIDIPNHLFDPGELSEDEINKLENTIVRAMFEGFKKVVIPNSDFSFVYGYKEFCNKFYYRIPWIAYSEEPSINWEYGHPIFRMLKKLYDQSRSV